MHRRGYETLQASITEMTNAVDGGELQFDIDKTKIEKILKRDQNPLFVTIQVAREGVSKNGRNYSAETMREIAEQINSKQPDGYKGHLTDEERGHKAPDAQTIWLGAKVVTDKDGKSSVYAKGYVMPSAKRFREYLETAADLGKNVAVSIFGGAKKAVYNAKEKAYDIIGIEVDSVDWARPGSEGIPNDGTLILASEMQTNNPKEDDKMDRVAVIKDVKLGEMTEHNPELVAEIKTAAKAELETTVSEMTEIKNVLGEKPLESIAEMQEKIRGVELTESLASRVQAKNARPVIRKMVLAEMKADEAVDATVERVLQTGQAQAIIKEMTVVPKVNPTNDDKSQSTARKFTQAA
jgi:hypothetical protein